MTALLRFRQLNIKIPLFLLLILCTVAKSQDYAIKDVTVIPMNHDTSFAHQTVLIEKGIIRKIGDVGKIKIGSAYIVIDGTGRYLMPGLFDMHAHFFHEQGEYKNTCEAELKMMLANGLTTARIMAGHPAYLEARANVRSGKWMGPELYVASPQLVGNWPWPPDFKNFEIVDTKDKAKEAVKKFKKEGYDAIKITFMVTREAYDEIIKTAKDVGIKVVGHVGPKVKLPAALAAGEQIEHMDEFIDMLLPDTSYNHGQSVSDMNIWRKEAWATVPYLDENKIPALAKSVKEAGIYVSPTNYFFISCFGEGRTEEQIKAMPDYSYIPPVILKEKWEIREHYLKNQPPEQSRIKYVYLRKKMVNELWKAGVPLMASSDSPEWFLVTGFSIHEELAAFESAGLTPYAVLQTVTVNPATYLGIYKKRGSIEEDKEADLLLLDKNPLEKTANTKTISGVMKGSTWLDRKALDQLLEEAKVLGK